MKATITMIMVGAGVLMTSLGAHAQAGRQAPPDMQTEQQACEGDVYALCGEFIPDTDRITACLRSRWKDVSPACRTVMANYGRNHNGRRDRRD